MEWFLELALAEGRTKVPAACLRAGADAEGVTEVRQIMAAAILLGWGPAVLLAQGNYEVPLRNPWPHRVIGTEHPTPQNGPARQSEQQP